MPDITLCTDQQCPLRQSCMRFVAKPDKYQSYFMGSPSRGDQCPEYWPVKSLTTPTNKRSQLRKRKL